jgi:hypothetical protein
MALLGDYRVEGANGVMALVGELANRVAGRVVGEILLRAIVYHAA